MSKKSRPVYGVACSFHTMDDENFDFDTSIFVVRYNTTNEDEAIKLTTCICGDVNTAKKMLLILDDEGQLW